MPSRTLPRTRAHARLASRVSRPASRPLRLSRLSRPSQEASDGKRLKRAFRKLCLRYHPDIAREEGAVEKFQELQEAYRVLADDGEGALDVPLPEDLEWSAHDWRWAMRYNRGNALSLIHI